MHPSSLSESVVSLMPPLALAVEFVELEELFDSEEE